MSEQQTKTEAAEHPASETPSGSGEATPAKDPVRRWTLIVLVIAGVLFAGYLRSDRVTPYTSQARVHALVVPVAAEVSGTVTTVAVDSNQVVEAGQVLFTLEADSYQLAVQNAEAVLKSL